MLLAERRQKAVVSKQGMFAIGHQHRRFNLRGIGIELAALMAEQSVYRRHADAQQRKEGDVELGDVAEVDQRRLAAHRALLL